MALDNGGRLRVDFNDVSMRLAVVVDATAHKGTGGGADRRWHKGRDRTAARLKVARRARHRRPIKAGPFGRDSEGTNKGVTNAAT
jgi:hypothetical protein